MPASAERRSGPPYLLDQFRVGDDHDGGAARIGFAHGPIKARISWQRLVNAHLYKLRKQRQIYLQPLGATQAAHEHVITSSDSRLLRSCHYAIISVVATVVTGSCIAFRCLLPAIR